MAGELALVPLMEELEHGFPAGAADLERMGMDEVCPSVARYLREVPGTSRSAFTRDALRLALAELRERELEKRHREGYLRHPVQPDEAGDWDDEQVWVD